MSEDLTSKHDAMKYGLKRETLAQILQVFAQYPDIHEVLLYGSRAKSTYRPDSDIDLALV